MYILFLSFYKIYVLVMTEILFKLFNHFFFTSACEFRYIFDLKLFLYSITVDFEDSNGDSYSP